MKINQLFQNGWGMLSMLLLLTISFMSCNKENDLEDPQTVKMQEATANYDYYTRFYVWNEDANGLSSLGSETNDDGIMDVKVIGDERIEFFEDGELMFTGTNLQEQNGGFTFDIQAQTMNDAELGEVKVRGYNHYRELGGEAQGLYAYTGDYMNVGLLVEVEDLEIILLMDFRKKD